MTLTFGDASLATGGDRRPDPLDRAEGETLGNERATLLLSVDFEDWHQLVRRRAGVADWERAGPALARQTDALLALLDELELHATFFVLGITARAHPALVEALAAGGHEIACHGDRHLPVAGQTPSQFADDLRASRATIAALAGREPAGYRAPAFSITTAVPWAYGVLAAEGFAYDASQNDSPRIRGHITPASRQPHQLRPAEGGALWEFPPAVARIAGVALPLGGASYWSLLPTPLIVRALARAGPLAGLYLHPHELDPQPLRAGLAGEVPGMARARIGLRTRRRNLARRRAPAVLRALAHRHRLITYGEAHAQLSTGRGTGS